MNTCLLITNTTTGTTIVVVPKKFSSMIVLLLVGISISKNMMRVLLLFSYKNSIATSCYEYDSSSTLTRTATILLEEY